MILRSVAAALLVVAAPQTAAAQSVPSKDSAELVVLNRGYVDAFMNGNAAWYDAHLWQDYVLYASDGSIVGRADFLKGNSAPMTYKSFGLDSVRVHLIAPDVALVSAITPYERPDGTKGVSRYTDTWVRRSGTWKAVRAQIVGIRGR